VAESYPASPASVPAIRSAVGDLLGGAAGLDPQRKIDILLAVTEAAANAVVHGSTSSADRIDLEAELRNHTLTVTIKDYGQGTSLDAASGGLGLGIPLIFALADHAEVLDAPPGTRVTLRFSV
jgi:serine/threonine-protein kinase RsbW